MVFSRKGPPEIDAQTLSGLGPKSTGEDSARIQALEAKVERLTALVESIWSILESKSSLNENHLKARLEKVLELRGSRELPKNACQKCHQKNAATRKQCVYCGEVLPTSTNTAESPFNF